MLLAACHIFEGDAVTTLVGNVVPRATKYSLQLDEGCHLEPSDQTWWAINHSCEPNLRVDVDRRLLIAIRNILPGEELTWHYNTTEWELASPFNCQCGAPTCLGSIRSLRHMTAEQRAAISPYLSFLIASRYDRFD